jgi:hypothetical protein
MVAGRRATPCTTARSLHTPSAKAPLAPAPALAAMHTPPGIRSLARLPWHTTLFWIYFHTTPQATPSSIICSFGFITEMDMQQPHRQSVLPWSVAGGCQVMCRPPAPAAVADRPCGAEGATCNGTNPLHWPPSFAGTAVFAISAAWTQSWRCAATDDGLRCTSTHRSCGKHGCGAPVARAGVRRSPHPEGILCVRLHAPHL